ncbi:MAG TPA: DUF4956 domain-containing protein [Gemmataceae bacterium]|nr:DUF4956 domain-containing protein [Gemmataceae bacterium]
MPDWLREAIGNGDIPSFELACARIGLGFMAGFVVAGVYLIGMGRKRDDTTLPTTLVLLTVIIALVTMVIGSNLARAFGLVGALSIVRFRTVVEDTRDTAFVIFAVVVGMAIGAGYAILAAVGIPVVLLAAVIMREARSEAPALPVLAMLTVRIGLGHDPDVLLGKTLEKHLDAMQLVGTATARQGAALELTYEVRLKAAAGVFALVAELNKIEGVQGVELRQT